MEKTGSKMSSTIKVLILFVLLASAFFAAWTIKMNTPINRPDNVSGETAYVWYDTHAKTAAVNSEAIDWTLDHRVPGNYVPVPGEDGLYMVIDDTGNVIKYMRAEEMDDGSLHWSEVKDEPEVIYEPVEGVDDVYRYMDLDTGDYEYIKFVRNEDDTFAFVDVDSYGNPFTDGADASTITDRFRYTGTGNIYELINEFGVSTGLYERYLDSNGNYIWLATSVEESNRQLQQAGNGQGLVGQTVQGPNGVFIGQNEYNANPDGVTPSTTTSNADGTYTVTETVINTETQNGIMYTYETITHYTYAADGTLVTSYSEGPYLKSQTQAETAVAAGQIESSLIGEYARVSAYVTYDSYTASEVLSQLNARRATDGLSTLYMDQTSDLYMIACIRAADMAIYDNASTYSSTYGTISDLCSRYGVNVYPLENVYRTSNQSGENIHLTLQANEGTRAIRESAVTQCAIVIATRNGQQYIVELFAY